MLLSAPNIAKVDINMASKKFLRMAFMALISDLKILRILVIARGLTR